MNNTSVSDWLNHIWLVIKIVYPFILIAGIILVIQRSINNRRKKHMAVEMTVEEMQENVTNILAGISAQNGYRKEFVAEIVNRLVTDTALASSVLAELNAGFDKADALFNTAAKAEAEEIDVPVPDDEALVANLFE